MHQEYNPLLHTKNARVTLAVDNNLYVETNSNSLTVNIKRIINFYETYINHTGNQFTNFQTWKMKNFFQVF